MDPASITFGIIGLFGTCVQAYQIFDSARDASKHSDLLFTMVRIEEQRFLAICKSFGLRANPKAEDKVDESPDDDMESLSSRFALNFDNDRRLEVVAETLQKILQLLADKETLGRDYGILFRGDSTKGTPQQLSSGEKPPGPLWKKNIRRPYRATVIALKSMQWSVVDQTKFSFLVQTLTTFNNGLESLLSKGQKDDLPLIISAQLANIDTIDDLDVLRRASERYQTLQQTADLKSFNLTLELSDTIDDDMVVNPESITDLDNAFEATEGSRNLRSLAAYLQGRKSERVIVEWKEYLPSPGGSEPTYPVKRRIDHLAKLLRQASNSPNLRVLRCVAYFIDSQQSKIGFVMRLPSLQTEPQALWLADARKTSKLVPVSLRSLIGLDEPMPPLEKRFELALRLCRSLFQLFASGWLHKGIRSANVIFFVTENDQKKLRSSDELQKRKAVIAMGMSNPWLMGFDYARPDVDGTETEELKSYSFEQELYRHPGSFHKLGAANPVTTNFKREFDIYSLGCVLLEIGLWKPLAALWKDSYRKDKSTFRSRLISVWSEDLRAKCGSRYRTVVYKCLSGLVPDVDETADFTQQKIKELDCFWEDVIVPLRQLCV